ncbi:oxidoreductase [Aspergillus eucalypticola CBS 122712]|uniref:Oxidoreductase n=1 Tax=Aspergillus eucalypticola (strain CBS 122712 / IBT 29274) TaxID=1448314 RepID=A0A317UN22_ASPEC|nr:oxidoreductase [Aspergillus eucalypticola CBS 122712]PWY63101.1 oxidoreductase [Aspergillus eucalypticola CBS 122712]
MGPAIPVIDFAPFHGGSNEDRQRLKNEIHHACKDLGFFQLCNHTIPPELQTAILEQSRDFFRLPVETKVKYDRDNDSFNRGYERFRAQNFEKRTAGDLKESFFLAGKFGLGPNKYPVEVTDPQLFRDTVDRYYGAVPSLTIDLMTVIAEMVGLGSDALRRFCAKPIATLRLLHYPPQAPDASELERGIGAHSDFGAITILLQDYVGGLQVWSRTSNEWVDVVPVPGAVVVNTGNMMMRWTNDRYMSNLHRVINTSGTARYSVPFFFDGNADFLVECLESCLEPSEQPKYGPITVNDWMVGRYADTFGGGEVKSEKDLVSLE